MARTTKKPKKQIPEVVQYALGHRIRIEILIVLNEGVYSAVEIAELLDQPLTNVSNHLRHLLEHGAIEIAESVSRRNFVQHYYRAVELPFVSQEEAEQMTPMHFELLAGIVVQSAVAEALAALWAGKLSDPRIILSWDWYNVDERGRQDLEAEEKQFLERVREIEVEATNRRSSSGEAVQSMLVTLFGYERARKGGDARRTAREMAEGTEKPKSPRSQNGE